MTPAGGAERAEAKAGDAPWSLLRSGCLGLMLGVGFGVLGLGLVFYELGWDVKGGKEPLMNVVATFLMTTPQALVIGAVCLFVCVGLRRHRLVSLLPVLTTVAATCLALWVAADMIEAQQLAMKEAVNQAIDENGFFLTRQIAKQLTWRTFFLVFVMLFTVILDIFCIPFVVLFDPDVLIAGGVLLLEFFGATTLGAIASGVLWAPLMIWRGRRARS